MAAKSTNTLQELLQRFLADLGQFKMVASDTDLASAVELETSILQMARKPIDSINAQGLTSAPPDAAMPAPGPSVGGGQRGMPAGGMPSPDELRRILGGG